LWYISESASGQTQTVYWGSPATDYITPGDYDGDNRTDFAVWRSGTGADSGYFFVLNTASAPLFLKWGQSAGAFTPPDYPVAAYQVH
jgi:hypothetical protein